VIRLLDEAGASMDQVGLLAVIAGPGSFTGLRVGIATVQGLAMAGGLRIVAVPALEALAAAVEAPDPRHLIAPWMDAQRGEVFAAAYTADGAGQLQPPSSDSPARALARLLARPGMEPIVFVGDGALRYRDLIAAGLGSRAAIVDPTPPLAPVAARYAAAHADRAVLPHAVVPIYVRRPDAELAKDRRGRP
jgi:tRNA threonylcarbamoyladenosine biosynthesis protein TsaB